MTLKDLQGDVYALGYEKPLDASEAFAVAANQAMRIIYAERKYEKTAKIRVRRTEEESKIPSINYIGEQLTLPLAGRAYSFRACGCGRVIINDGETVREVSFDSDETLIRGFLRQEGSLTMLGDCSYEICDLTTYREIFSDKTEDIPDGSGYKCFNFSQRKDFLSFADAARDECGKKLGDSRIEDSCLYVKCDTARDVYVKYNRAPRRITLDDLYAEIDIPRQDEASLVLLTASLLWRDDEPELAENYYNTYKNLQSTAKRCEGSSSTKYEICDRWT